MYKYRIGQRVKVIMTHAEAREFLDMVFIVQAYLGFASVSYPNEPCYDIGIARVAEQCALAPVYDGDEKSSWSNCAWNPFKAKA